MKDIQEQEVIRLIGIAHPQDQGEPTSILENELRQALTLAEQRGREEVLKEIEERIKKNTKLSQWQKCYRSS